MEKIKIELSTIKNVIVKYGKQKMEIQPYISNEDIILINDICLSQFISKMEFGMEQFKVFPLMKSVFDACIICKCTNIEVDGIKINNESSNNNITLTLTESTLSKINKSGIVEIIKKHIINYDEVYNIVSQGISLANVYGGLSLLAKNIPNTEDIKKSVEAMVEFTSKNKDLIDSSKKYEIVQDTLLKTKNETKNKLSKNKKSK